jgi:hypothetical protein
MGLVKGICYGNDAFPYPYNESNANSYQCTFGSDSTADYVAPLHGGQYMSPVKLWCQEAQGIPDPPPCRNDLNNIHSMGVELLGFMTGTIVIVMRRSSNTAAYLVSACWSVFRIITSDPPNVCQV